MVREQGVGGGERGASTGALVYWDVVSPRAATFKQEKEVKKGNAKSFLYLPHRVVCPSPWLSHCEGCVKVVGNMGRACNVLY